MEWGKLAGELKNSDISELVFLHLKGWKESRMPVAVDSRLKS